MILGLDLGAKTGYALADSNYSIIKSGVWKLEGKSRVNRANDLKQKIRLLTKPYQTVSITFEDALMANLEAGQGNTKDKRGRNLAACRHYLALENAVETFADFKNWPCEGMHVMTIKAKGAGNGKSTKAQMILMAKSVFKSEIVEDDNHADALLIIEALRVIKQIEANGHKLELAYKNEVNKCG